MRTAGVPNVNGPLLDLMTGTAVGRAAVDGVLVVEAPAGRVQLK